MRITTSNAFDSSLANLQRRQQALTETQEQLTSGKRVRKPSDDPAAAARAERALASVSRSEAQMRALEASRSAMQGSESALGDASELMQQARERLVSAGNGGYTDSERFAIAKAIRGLRDDLLTVANRSDGAGRYLFGGRAPMARRCSTTWAAWPTTPPPGSCRGLLAKPRRCRWMGARRGCKHPTRPTPARCCRSSMSWTAWWANC